MLKLILDLQKKYLRHQRKKNENDNVIEFCKTTTLQKRKYCAIIKLRQINEMENKQKISRQTEKTLAILE
ncbi:hypothetical protein ACS0PU_000561 [Formica fusca]